MRDYAAISLAEKVKPEVHYVPSQWDTIKLGERATLLRVLDHPDEEVVRSNKLGAVVSTSPVVKIHEHGFETRNSRYIPQGDPDEVADQGSKGPAAA